MLQLLSHTYSSTLVNNKLYVNVKHQGGTLFFEGYSTSTNLTYQKNNACLIFDIANLDSLKLLTDNLTVILQFQICIILT